MQVATREAVGDHDSARMLGTSDDGRGAVDSEKRIGLGVLKTAGMAGLGNGLGRRGGAISKPSSSAAGRGGVPPYYGEQSIAITCCWESDPDVR